MTVKVTIGKDDRIYYFSSGKRISTAKAKELLKVSSKMSHKKLPKKTGDECGAVDCPPEKICNPSSGRCVKRSGRIGKDLVLKKSRKESRKESRKGGNCEGVKCSPVRVCLEATGKCVKPCLPRQVRNNNNRCVNKSGFKRDREKVGKYKPCPPHQVRDPVTHRCKNELGFKRERHNKTKPRPSYRGKSRWKDTKKDERDCVSRSQLTLRAHQKKVVRYMRTHRSLLVVHGTGTGKTLTAATISQCYLDDNPTHKVVFVGPVSLKSNFKKELRNYGIRNIDIAKHYRFYSFAGFLNATKKRTMNKVRDSKERESISWPLNPINLKNTLLVVDEAHNMRNPRSSTSRALVAASFKADKVLLLTATPFVNSMRDFIPLINMLDGKYFVGTYGEFQSGQVNDYLSKEPTKDNLNTFESLLQDKVDVVDKRDEKFFPKRKDHMLFVKMTPAYLDSYTKLMDEQHVAGIWFKDPHRFYNGFRRAVNKAGPEYFSNKVKKAIPILKKGKALIYSNWRDFGVKPISESLKESGISFMTFTGSTKVSDRQEIIDAFNTGEFQVLVVTKAGGEGLDLKGVRSVIVLDPTWNDAGLQQVIGRAVRYRSHEHLPKKDRVVNVYLMALVAPGTNVKKLHDILETSEENPDEEITLSKNQIIDSGDLLLYDIIERKNKIEAVLMKALKKMSITR
jgi:superfamily II DNA or RNA helicase